MKRRLGAALMAAVCAAAWPLAAQAVTYAINVPVQLSNIPFPAGTQVTVGCFIWTSSNLNQVPQPNQNMQGMMAWSKGLALNGQGSLSTTVTLSITEPSTAPAFKSYTCALEGTASNGLALPFPSGGNPEFQDSCVTSNFDACVSGRFP
jgi:hypothetical protein